MQQEEKIRAVETHFDIELPQNYRDFLCAKEKLQEFIGDYFLEIYPIDEVRERSEIVDFQDRFPKSVVIGGNGSRELLAYDFRQTPPTLVLLDISAPDWTSAIYQADSLQELLELFPKQGWKFE